MAAAGWGDDEWEAYDNEGFVYKRKKRSHPDLPTTSAAGSAADPTADERIRRKRKRNALLKIRDKYKAEISQWELLSNTLRALEKEAESKRRVMKEPSTSSAQGNKDVGFGLERGGAVYSAIQRQIDDLAVRVEADHAIVQGISDLCDVAEAICNTQEQHLKKQYLDLPIFESPRKLMNVLCDTRAESGNGEGI